MADRVQHHDWAQDHKNRMLANNEQAHKFLLFPHRYLSDDGSGRGQLSPIDLVSLNPGKRLCEGESESKNEVDIVHFA
jgi:hypothetical protein